MGSLLSKACSGSTPPLLSLNDTCQRLRCLMACCGGEVNVLSRDEHDGVDKSTQTENDEEVDEEGENPDEEGRQEDSTSAVVEETSV